MASPYRSDISSLLSIMSKFLCFVSWLMNFHAKILIRCYYARFVSAKKIHLNIIRFGCGPQIGKYQKESQ